MAAQATYRLYQVRQPHTYGDIVIKDDLCTEAVEPVQWCLRHTAGWIRGYLRRTGGRLKLVEEIPGPEEKAVA